MDLEGGPENVAELQKVEGFFRAPPTLLRLQWQVSPTTEDRKTPAKERGGLSLSTSGRLTAEIERANEKRITAGGETSLNAGEEQSQSRGTLEIVYKTTSYEAKSLVRHNLVH